MTRYAQWRLFRQLPRPDKKGFDGYLTLDCELHQAKFGEEFIVN